MLSPTTLTVSGAAKATTGAVTGAGIAMVNTREWITPS